VQGLSGVNDVFDDKDVPSRYTTWFEFANRRFHGLGSVSITRIANKLYGDRSFK
jgi:hypothetical protein